MVYLEAQAFLQLPRHCEEVLDVCNSLGFFLVLYMSTPADLPRQSQSGESLEQLTLSTDRRDGHSLIGHYSKERGLL